MTDHAEILIAGGGYVGLTLALALKLQAPGLTVMVADAAPAGAGGDDMRASAIAAAARQMLENLGVWDEIADEAQPINEMVITDSRSRDAVRPVFLTFAGAFDEDTPFAHMVPNGPMVAALARRAADTGVEFMRPQSVIDFTVEEGAVVARFADGRSLRARLLVAADGIRSRLRALSGIGTVEWTYGQSGIVTTVAHERPHHGRAVEHFLPAGPFAILPLKGNRSSLVWTEATRDADRLVAMDDFTFTIELERRFGHRLGRVEPLGPRRAWPLGLTLARAFVKPRFALAGDAAHGIHPIAGQGLNLGFKDAAALAETLVDAHRTGLDIGQITVLERYQRWRRFDTFQMGVATDVLNRLFSNDYAAIRLARDVGLGLVDRLPALKDWFIREAAGVTGEMPRLMRAPSAPWHGSVAPPEDDYVSGSRRASSGSMIGTPSRIG